MYGLEGRHWQLVEEIVLRPLVKKNVQLYVFGSRARGDHKKFSDLDLLVVGPDIERSDLTAIIDNLENSNLPIKVDLVWEKDLADSYRSGVEKDKQLISLKKDS